MWRAGCTGWPPAITGNPAIDTYFLFAVAGSVCLMVCYLLVEIAAMWFVGAPRFTVGARRDGESGRIWCCRPPARLVIVAVLWFSVKDSADLVRTADARLVLVRNGSGHRDRRVRIAKRVGAALAAEVGLSAGRRRPTQVR